MSEYESTSKNESQLSTTMQNPINKLFEGKGVYRELLQKRIDLENELENLCKQYNNALENEKKLLKATIQLNDSLPCIQNSIKYLTDAEEIAKQFPTKMMQLETGIGRLQNLFVSAMEKEYGELKAQLAENAKQHKEEISILNEQCLLVVQNQKEVLDEVLKGKMDEINQLKEQIITIQQQHKQEINAIKAECEEKLTKMQEQQAKHTKPLASPSTSITTDIFRQKLLNLQGEHALEITSLQRTIGTLHLQMQQCPNCSASAAFQKEFDEFIAFKKMKK